LSMTKLTKVQQRLFCNKLRGYRWGDGTLYEMVMNIGAKLRTCEAEVLGFKYRITLIKFVQPIPFDPKTHETKLDRHDFITTIDAIEKKIFDRFYILLPAPQSGIKSIVIGQNLYETDSFTVLTQAEQAKARGLSKLLNPVEAPVKEAKTFLKSLKLPEKERPLKAVKQEPAKIEMLDIENVATPERSPEVEAPAISLLAEKTEEAPKKAIELPQLGMFARMLVRMFGKEQYRELLGPKGPGFRY